MHSYEQQETLPTSGVNSTFVVSFLEIWRQCDSEQVTQALSQTQQNLTFPILHLSHAGFCPWTYFRTELHMFLDWKKKQRKSQVFLNPEWGMLFANMWYCVRKNKISQQCVGKYQIQPIVDLNTGP